MSSPLSAERGNELFVSDPTPKSRLLCGWRSFDHLPLLEPPILEGLLQCQPLLLLRASPRCSGMKLSYSWKFHCCTLFPNISSEDGD